MSSKALPTLLFIQTGPDQTKQNRHLVEALQDDTDGLIRAIPVRGSSPQVRTKTSEKQVGYIPEHGLAGILSQVKSSNLADMTDGLIVLSDQILGPLSSKPRFGSSQDAVSILVKPDGRGDATENMELATAEPAGPLAMELTCIEIPGAVLISRAFDRAIAKARSLGEAELGWLDLSGFVATLREEGIPLTVQFEGPNDLFARDLAFYLDAEIPFLPWALFTTNPLVLERWAVVPRYAFDYLGGAGYSADLFWDRVLKSCAPQTWYTNLSLLDILPPTAPRGFVNRVSAAVIAHVFYPEMLDGMLHWAGNVPDPVELFVTTNTDEKKAELEEALRRQERFAKWEVRVVTTNRGRDVSALLIDCADVIRNPKFDVILKLHSKKSVQDPSSVSGWFSEHLFQNLASSPGYVKQIMKRFQDDPNVGIIMPPVIHMGVPTMGNGWTLNKGPAEQLASRIGVTVPFDNFTPLAPYGSMFYARREALVPLVDAEFAPEEFPDAQDYRDGSVAHVLERMFGYVAFSQGYYARCVQCAELAEISSTALLYKYDQISHYLFPFALRQVKLLGGGEGALSNAEVRSLVQRQLSAHYPRTGDAALKVWTQAKRIIRGVQRRVLGS